MNEVPLFILIKYVKTFDGDRFALHQFTDNCQSAYDLANASQMPILSSFIKNNIRGRAALLLHTQNANTWPEIKTYLEQVYGEKKHLGQIELELRQCKQLQTETITQYATNWNNFLKIITSDPQWNNKKKELPGRFAAVEDTAINTFLPGLWLQYYSC